jgi:hypothetical protein
MTTTEIKHEVSRDQDAAYISEQGVQYNIAMFRSDVTAQQFVDSYNNTYGKGINPESVEKMYAALVMVRERLRSSHTKQGAAEAHQQNLLDLEEALTAAKL